MESREMGQPPPEPGSNFYQDVIGAAFIMPGMDASFEAILLENRTIEEAVAIAESYPGCVKLGEKMDLGYEYAQVLICPDKRILVLREEKSH